MQSDSFLSSDREAPRLLPDALFRIDKTVYVMFLGEQALDFRAIWSPCDESARVCMEWLQQALETIYVEASGDSIDDWLLSIPGLYLPSEEEEDLQPSLWD